jgi:Arc/MetJ-type ribon-helix-helix transcriptional regulator
MTYDLSPQIDQRIQAQLALGVYQSPEEVLSDALDALEQRNSDWESIARGIDDERAGRMKSLADADRDMRTHYGLPIDE